MKGRQPETLPGGTGRSAGKVPSSPPVPGGWAGKLRARWRELGASGLLLLVFTRLLPWLSGGRVRLYAYTLVAQPIAPMPAPPASRGSQTELRWLSPGDPLLAQLAPPPAVIQRRFASGAECLAATVRGEFAGTLWIARGAYDEDEVRCRFELADPARSVWDFDVYVEPRFRGSRVFARLWQAANERLAAEGVQWSFSRIASLNRASLEAHRRLGAAPVARALFLKVGRAQCAVLPRTPYFHLGWPSHESPRIALAPPPRGRTATP